ncbi:hypothetical protein K438DRAFT_1986474 [Mycena galopus ATCC 62051]|nr:hypothetical protein K438DRAFT_1986474 [Mycena galopus ATCC 62051]
MVMPPCHAVGPSVVQGQHQHDVVKDEKKGYDELKNDDGQWWREGTLGGAAFPIHATAPEGLKTRRAPNETLAIDMREKKKRRSLDEKKGRLGDEYEYRMKKKKQPSAPHQVHVLYAITPGLLAFVLVDAMRSPPDAAYGLQKLSSWTTKQVPPVETEPATFLPHPAPSSSALHTPESEYALVVVLPTATSLVRRSRSRTRTHPGHTSTLRTQTTPLGAYSRRLTRAFPPPTLSTPTPRDPDAQTDTSPTASKNAQ